MIRKRYILLLVAVSSLTMLVSCNKMETPAEESSDMMTFMPCIATGSDATRGEMITGTTYNYTKLGAFWVKVWNSEATSAQFGYTKVRPFTHTTGSMHGFWSTVDSDDNLTEYFWKKSGNNPETKYFYAYTNLPSTGATVTSTQWNSQTLSYNVATLNTAAQQKDILLGLGSGTGYTKETYVGRYVKITFRHPLSAVKFEKGTIAGWTTGDAITNIRIVGVYASGSYSNSTSGSTWTPSGSTTVSMPGLEDTFFLIPQTFSTKSITIKADIVAGGVTRKDVEGTITTGNWQAGYYYTYTINMDEDGKSLNLSVNIANWGKNDKDLEISSDFVLGYDPAVDPWDDADDTHLTYTD